MEPTNPTEVSPSLECCGLLLTDTRLSESDGSRIVLSVERSQVRAIALRRGFECRHPFIQALLGAAISAVGVITARAVFVWLTQGGEVSIGDLVLLSCLPIGLWLLLSAFHRGWYLRVESDDKERRLFFGKRAIAEDVASFVSKLEQRWGIEVSHEIRR